MRQAEIFIQADQLFNDYVTQIDAKWNTMVPSTPEWSVEQLVSHVTSNNEALTTLLGGSPVTAEGDIETHWTQSAETAEAAANEQNDPTVMVAAAAGPSSVGDTLLTNAADRTLHSWDLAHAIGANESIEPGLIQAIYDFLAPKAEQARAAGVFGPAVTVGADATLQQRLLALTGRDSGYVHDEPTRDPSAERANEIHRS